MSLQEKLKEQSAVIQELTAEVELLTRQIALRKPKGGGLRVPAGMVARIEHDLREDRFDRDLARRYDVSRATVRRLRRRMELRTMIAAAGG